MNKTIHQKVQNSGEGPDEVLHHFKIKNVNRLATGHLSINSLLNWFDTLNRHRLRHSLDISMIIRKNLEETFPEGLFLVNWFTQPYGMDRNPKLHGLALYFEEDITSRQNSFGDSHVDTKILSKKLIILSKKKNCVHITVTCIKQIL